MPEEGDVGFAVICLSEGIPSPRFSCSLDCAGAQIGAEGRESKSRTAANRRGIEDRLFIFSSVQLNTLCRGSASVRSRPENLACYWRQSSAQTRVLSITFLIVCKYICLTRWFESFA